MAYERKKRNVSYHTDSCKMYLRHDFKHKCAYCGVAEEFITVIPEMGDKYFEKDHFLPQNDNPPEMHAYPNLYYSCNVCNNKKNAISLPLDPCVHNIFDGEQPHIQGGTPDTNYILMGATVQGAEYITALELNSRYHINVREEEYARLFAQTEAKQIFRDLEEKGVLAPEELQRIAISLGILIGTDAYKHVCGGSKYAIDFANACHYLESKGYKPEIKFDENEMDIKVIMGTDTYWGTIRISDSVKECRIKTSILRERRKMNETYGVFTYIPLSQTMCFYKIDFENVDWNKTHYRVVDYILL